MPTLEFKGKQHIYAHHLTVPYRSLETDETCSCNPTGENDNLIIHGDNLHALKALLPHYTNRVKCIYIDPPYNTGNEGWVYNDKGYLRPSQPNYITSNAKNPRNLCNPRFRQRMTKTLHTLSGF